MKPSLMVVGVIPGALAVSGPVAVKCWSTSANSEVGAGAAVVVDPAAVEPPVVAVVGATVGDADFESSPHEAASSAPDTQIASAYERRFVTTFPPEI
jgi:hypothetical protein